ncbi:hypothetical protein OPQ81_000450 [Rhizoctonia solani]|nr:hypothetical protein OPQ81_000450 [Rhizoctonia solani]
MHTEQANNFLPQPLNTGGMNPPMGTIGEWNGSAQPTGLLAANVEINGPHPVDTPGQQDLVDLVLSQALPQNPSPLRRSLYGILLVGGN